MDEVKEQVNAGYFQNHPENINMEGAPDKEFRWREIFIKRVQQQKEGQEKKVLMADAMIDAAVGGNVQAFKEIADRMEGKAPQGIGTLDPNGVFKPQNLVVLYGSDESETPAETQISF